MNPSARQASDWPIERPHGRPRKEGKNSVRPSRSSSSPGNSTLSLMAGRRRNIVCQYCTEAKGLTDMKTKIARERTRTKAGPRLYHIHLTDAFTWLSNRKPHSIHAVVTDPPYGLLEYTSEQLEKMENGQGGVWRIPPSFDGSKRRPLPRFTVLKKKDKEALCKERCGRD